MGMKSTMNTYGGTQLCFLVGMSGTERWNGVLKSWFFAKVTWRSQELKIFNILRAWNSGPIYAAELKVLLQESKFIIFAQSGGLKNWILLQLGI